MAKYSFIKGGKKVRKRKGFPDIETFKQPHNPDHDWYLLSDEKDGPMIRHALEYTTQNCLWHKDFVNVLMGSYLKDSKHRTIIDVGASYGWMAVSFAKHFKEVKCFEIRSDVRYALRKNVRFFPNVEVFDYGLGSKEDEVLLGDTMVTGSTRVVDEDGYLGSPKNNVKTSIDKAPILPLDSLNFENVDCIKIDVEGYEFLVLQGALETIKKWKPLLIVEIKTLRQAWSFEHRQQIFNMLKSIGYEIADIRRYDFIFTQA